MQDAYLTDQDLQIGRVVPIFARCWELLDADHNTCKYMEENKDKYPHADYDKVRAACASYNELAYSGCWL